MDIGTKYHAHLGCRFNLGLSHQRLVRLRTGIGALLVPECAVCGWQAPGPRWRAPNRRSEAVRRTHFRGNGDRGITIPRSSNPICRASANVLTSPLQRSSSSRLRTRSNSSSTSAKMQGVAPSLAFRFAGLLSFRCTKSKGTGSPSHISRHWDFAFTPRWVTSHREQ